MTLKFPTKNTKNESQRAETFMRKIGVNLKVESAQLGAKTIALKTGLTKFSVKH